MKDQMMRIETLEKELRGAEKKVCANLEAVSPNALQKSRQELNEKREKRAAVRPLSRRTIGSMHSMPPLKKNDSQQNLASLEELLDVQAAETQKIARKKEELEKENASLRVELRQIQKEFDLLNKEVDLSVKEKRILQSQLQDKRTQLTSAKSEIERQRLSICVGQRRDTSMISTNSHTGPRSLILAARRTQTIDTSFENVGLDKTDTSEFYTKLKASDENVCKEMEKVLNKSNRDSKSVETERELQACRQEIAELKKSREALKSALAKMELENQSLKSAKVEAQKAKVDLLVAIEEKTALINEVEKKLKSSLNQNSHLEDAVSQMAHKMALMARREGDLETKYKHAQSKARQLERLLTEIGAL